MRTVNVVDLCGPEEQHNEEVATAEESDEQDKSHGALVFAEEFPGRHRVFCAKDFPNEVGDNQDDAENEGHEDVNAAPGVL